MARISNLAGRINRHKQSGGSPIAGGTNRHGRGSYRTAPYHPRAGYRGGHGAHTPTHRNKTLVINGQNQPTDSEANANDASPTSWVSKTDRHLQLINSAVYEKNSQNRVDAIAQTQRQNQLRKDQKEKAHIMKYMQQTGNSVRSNTKAAPSQYDVFVDGIRFHVTGQGSKLVRAPGTNNPSRSTPRVTTIGGVQFYRTKNGNLVRHGIVTAHRMAAGIKKVDEPCRTFTWTGIVFSKLRDRQTCDTLKPRCGKNPN